MELKKLLVGEQSRGEYSQERKEDTQRKARKWFYIT